MLCYDMARCVFQRESPSLSYSSFNVLLPCYEASWEAKSSGDCFSMLKTFPAPCSLSCALKALQNCRPGEDPSLEISGYGMFSLIKGELYRNFQGAPNANNLSALHGILFCVTQGGLVPFLHTSHSVVRRSHCRANSVGISKILRESIDTQTIETVSNNVTEKYGGDACRSVNAMLNAWRRSWEARKFRDVQSDGRNFLCDPLPFWFLAKAFLIVHLTEGVDADCQILDISKGKPVDLEARAILQAKLCGWLKRFRLNQNRRISPENPEGYGRCSRAPDESRTVFLIEPLC